MDMASANFFKRGEKEKTQQFRRAVRGYYPKKRGCEKNKRGRTEHVKI